MGSDEVTAVGSGVSEVMESNLRMVDTPKTNDDDEPEVVISVAGNGCSNVSSTSIFFSSTIDSKEDCSLTFFGTEVDGASADAAVVGVVVAAAAALIGAGGAVVPLLVDSSFFIATGCPSPLQTLANKPITLPAHGSTTSSNPVASSAKPTFTARTPPNSCIRLSITFPMAQNTS